MNNFSSQYMIGNYKMCQLSIMKIVIVLLKITTLSFGQEIKLHELKQEDCKTKCTAGLLSNIDWLSINTTFTLPNDLLNTTIVRFELMPNNGNILKLLFSVDVKSECMGTKTTGSSYYCSKIAENNFNMSIFSEVLPQFSNAIIRGVIQNYNQTEIASDQLRLPEIVDSTDVSGILTANGLKLSKKENCSIVIDEHDLNIEFECSGPATPCLIEISSNDSTQIHAGENRISFKRFLFQEASLLIKIKYALCRLDLEYVTMECAVIKGAITYQKVGMILTLLTGIPTILILLVTIFSIVRMVHSQKKKENDIEKNSEEAIHLTRTDNVDMENRENKENVLNDNAKRSLEVKQEMAKALIHAAENGLVGTVKMLLKKGGDLAAKYDNDVTALMLASKHGHLQIVDLLLKNTSDINRTDPNGQNALMMASLDGHFEIAEILIRNGANVNEKDTTGMSSLMLALKNNNIQIIELLLDKGADWKQETDDRTTTLMLAAKNGLNQVVEKLIKLGAKVNENNKLGFSPLLYALENKHSLTANMLLQNGANKNERDTDSNSALMIAARSGLTDVVKTLIHNKANIEDKNTNGTNSLMLATTNGHAEIVEMLINNGADINIKNKFGMTALMLASKMSDTKTVQNIIESVKNVRGEKGKKVNDNVKQLINEKNNKGHSALMFASQNGVIETVKLLLENKASVDDKNTDGWTSLMFASEKGHIETVKALLKGGANINSQNNLHQTAFMHAFHNRHTDVVELLYEKRAIITTKHEKEMTALKYARENNKTKL